MIISDWIPLSHDKTKVALLGVHPILSQIIRYILDYHEKSYDFVNDKISSVQNGDFFIIETNSQEVFQEYNPTILFLGSFQQVQDYASVIEKITAGGFLVYPNFVQDLDKAVLQSQNYFKKYEYKLTNPQHSENSTILDTDFGGLALPSLPEELTKDIEGAVYFCQQLGVMQDEFYDALSTWAV